MKRKYIIWLIVIAVLALIIFKLASNKKVLEEKKKPDTDTVVRIPVKVAIAKEQQMETSLLKTGDVAPFREAKALSTISGTVQELRFNLGDQVKEGQVLAIMDTRLLQLDLQKSEENARKLKRDLDTYTELLQGQAATQEKVNEIRQNYLDAENAVRQVRKQISDAAVKAPTSGIISEKSVEKGVYLAAGTEMATIVNLSQAKIALSLTEAEVYQVKEGQQVKVSTDVYPDKKFNGKVTFISPQADETHSYKLELLIENTERSVLRSGTFVYVDFSQKSVQQVLVIPREALNESVKDATVFVVQDGVAKPKTIKTGPEIKGMIQVIDGLNSGESVVTSGQINLKDGTKVTITK